MLLNHDGADQANVDGIEYRNDLYSYALFLTRNYEQTEDLVQETYLRALKAKEKLRASSNIKGWLFTILKNIWLNQLRKWRNGPEMLHVDVNNIADKIVKLSKDSHDLYVSKMDAENVRAAIERLPAESRKIILLREFEELSYLEIARTLNCPVGTVMSRLGRARAQLRELLSAASTRR